MRRSLAQARLIGSAIRNRRRRAGISIADMARNLRITKDIVRKVENGTIGEKWGYSLACAIELGVDLRSVCETDSREVSTSCSVVEELLFSPWVCETSAGRFRVCCAPPARSVDTGPGTASAKKANQGRG